MFNSSPTFFWGHIIVFELAMLAMLVGWQTKWTKWVAWFCFQRSVTPTSPEAGVKTKRMADC